MFFKQSLQRKLIKGVDNERVVKYMSLTEISSLGFLFNINDDEMLDTIKKLCEIADSRSIKFQAIALNTLKHPYPKDILDYRISVINKQDLNYLGLPKTSSTELFTSQIFNLFIDFTSVYNFTCDYISHKSKSSFKIGRLSYESNPFDLVLENIKDGTGRNYLNSIIHYLSSIRSV
ncbi:MAG: hypothetical protein AB9922_00925 [Bacteroidales bacterium]